MGKLLVTSVCAIAAISFSGEPNAMSGGAAVALSDPLSRQIALLQIKKQDRYFACAGIYYSQHFIVTAAHCLTIAPENVRKLPANERDTAYRTAPQVRIGDIKVFYRHVGSWLQPKEFRLDRENDVAIIVMRSPHPVGYQAELFDERSANEIVEQLRDATFVHLGHEKLGPGSAGEVRRLSRKAARLMVQSTTDRIIMEAAGDVGTCRGDSGAPVYIEEGSGRMKLVGMHQAGAALSAQFAIPGTDGNCSRISIFTPIARVKQLVEKLMAE
jgi:hypothetical protein